MRVAGQTDPSRPWMNWRRNVAKRLRGKKRLTRQAIVQRRWVQEGRCSQCNQPRGDSLSSDCCSPCHEKRRARYGSVVSHLMGEHVCRWCGAVQHNGVLQRCDNCEAAKKKARELRLAAIQCLRGANRSTALHHRIAAHERWIARYKVELDTLDSLEKKRVQPTG